jgi:membrane protease subunit HflK
MANDPSQPAVEPQPAASRLPVTRAPQPAPGALSGDDAGSVALAEALSSSFKIIKGLMVLLVVVFIASGLFTVNPNEVAVILRCGQPVGTGADQLLKPGLHFAFPRPIDEIVKIPVGQSHTVVSTNGWHAYPPEMENAAQALPFLRAGVDGYTITADGDVIHARAILKYRLQPSGALNYTFVYANPTNLIQNALDNALIYASTRFTADAAIFKDKISFNDLVLKRVSQLLDEWQLGIAVETLEVQTSPPLDVRQAFDAVLEAQQTARTKISEAESYARGATNSALGQASVVLNDALTHSNQLVRTVLAEAKSFQDQLPFFQANPVLFKQRLLTDTMQRVLTNAQDKFYVPTRSDGKPRELRLQLSREPQKPKEGAQP